MEAPGLMLWVGIAKHHGVEVDLGDSRLWEKYNYGFESRGIPLWATTDLAYDLIVDYVNREAREWRKAWASGYYYEGLLKEIGITTVKKEDSRAFLDLIAETRQRELDEMDIS